MDKSALLKILSQDKDQGVTKSSDRLRRVTGKAKHVPQSTAELAYNADEPVVVLDDPVVCMIAMGGSAECLVTVGVITALSVPEGGKQTGVVSVPETRFIDKGTEVTMRLLHLVTEGNGLVWRR